MKQYLILLFLPIKPNTAYNQFIITYPIFRDEMKTEYNDMKNDYGTIKSELATLRKTYGTKSDEWIKEKLNLQQRMKDLEDSLTSSSGGEGWDSERDRFKNIIEDRDNQITQLKIEGNTIFLLKYTLYVLKNVASFCENRL